VLYFRAKEGRGKVNFEEGKKNELGRIGEKEKTGEREGGGVGGKGKAHELSRIGEEGARVSKCGVDKK